MKKRMMFVAAGAAAMVMGTTGLAEEELKSMSVDYGFSIEADGLVYDATYNVMSDSAGNGTISMVLNINENGEQYSFPLEDVAIITSESLYVSVEDIKDLYETINGEEIDNSLLETFGITGEWIEVPYPELEALDIDFTKMGETPELSEELLTELQMLLFDYFPDMEDDKMTITINNEKVIASAAQLDNILGTYGEEISGLLHMNGAAFLQDLDIKPAIKQYIQAAAEGAEEAGVGLTAEEAEEMLNSIIDDAMAQLNAEMSVSAGSVEITPEMLAELHLADLLTNALEGTEFEGKIVVEDGNSAECTLTVNGSAVILKLGLTEDGLVRGTLENSTGVLYSGEVTAEGSGLKLTITDEKEQKTVLTGTMELKENGLAFTVSGDEFEVAITAEGEETDNGMNGKIALDMDAAGEKVSLSGYLNATELDTPIEVEIPEAVSALDVTKEISKIYFAMQGESSDAE